MALLSHSLEQALRDGGHVINVLRRLVSVEGFIVVMGVGRK